MTEAFMKTNCYIHALCGYVPDAVLTNDDLSAMVDTNDEWITSRTGIKRRHKLSADQNASDLAVEAAQKNQGPIRRKGGPHHPQIAPPSHPGSH